MSKEDGFLPDPEMAEFIRDIERPLFVYRMSRAQIDSFDMKHRKANRKKLRKAEDEMWDILRKCADATATDEVTL